MKLILISSLDNLKSFDFVGTDNDIDAFLSDITAMIMVLNMKMKVVEKMYLVINLD